MTQLRHAVSPDNHHEQRVPGGDAFRAGLEQHRRFRIEQLKDLESDMSAGTDGAMDDVTSTLMTAATAALEDIVEVWGYGSFPASDPPANW